MTSVSDRRPVSSAVVAALFILLAAAAPLGAAGPLVFENFVGTPGIPGNANGTGPAAKISSPYHIAMDPEGNMFIPDYGNHIIRKVTPWGEVSTYAGVLGQAGSTDGAGTAARFNLPGGVCCDALGVVYIADTGNSTIRRIGKDRVVSTIAGLAMAVGTADGNGTAARFRFPNGMTVGAFGYIYVADTYNHTIRKIAPAAPWAVTTAAGVAGATGIQDGTGAAARFNLPTGISTAGANGGVMYIADYQNHTIRKMNSDNNLVETFAGLGGQNAEVDGDPLVARFSFPYGVAAASDGSVYVTDFGAHTVRLVQPDGKVATAGGKAGVQASQDGAGAAARFNEPTGIALSMDGVLCVAHHTGYCISRVLKRPAAGEYNWGNFLGFTPYKMSEADANNPQFMWSPKGMVFDPAGNLVVVEGGRNRIRRVDRTGATSVIAGSGTYGFLDGSSTAAQFASPSGIALSRDGGYFVADTFNFCIRKVTAGGAVSTLAGKPNNPGAADGVGTAALFDLPSAVVEGPDLLIYVADTENHAIRRITPSGQVTTFAGTLDATGYANGTGPAARFFYPRGIACDPAGNLYVADSSTYTIRKITPARVVTTYAGQGNIPGSTDGPVATARFAFPTGLFYDRRSGDLYVTDLHKVRRISAQGIVSTLGGSTLPGYEGGPGAEARFNYPAGIAVDPAGVIFVSDTESWRLSMGCVRGAACDWVSPSRANALFDVEPWTVWSLERSTGAGAGTGPWTTLVPSVRSAANGSVYYVDSAPPAGKAFYRLKPQ